MKNAGVQTHQQHVKRMPEDSRLMILCQGVRVYIPDVLEIDPYAAEVVQRIYTMYIKGAGQLCIANILNAEGVLCPSEYKKQNGENYRNSKKK